MLATLALSLIVAADQGEGIMSYVVRPMPAPVAASLLEKARRVETATVGHRRQMGFMHPAIQAIHKVVYVLHVDQECRNDDDRPQPIDRP